MGLYLIRLVNGQIPEYLDAPRHWVYLDQILSQKSSHEMVKQESLGKWLRAKDVDRILQEYSQVLRQYAEEVLTGKTGLFESLEGPGPKGLFHGQGENGSES